METVPHARLVEATNYVALGCDPDNRRVIILSAGMMLLTVETEAEERKSNEVLPCTIYKIFPWGQKDTGAMIDKWLRGYGFPGDKIRKTIRELTGSMASMLRKQLDQYQRGMPKPAKPAILFKSRKERSHALARKARRGSKSAI